MASFKITWVVEQEADDPLQAVNRILFAFPNGDYGVDQQTCFDVVNLTNGKAYSVDVGELEGDEVLEIFGE